MKIFRIFPIIVIASVLPSAAIAFECPKHFTDAQASIDKVMADMKSMKMEKADMARIHALLDDAKMYLQGAKHNHTKPQNIDDHARSMAKADTALGYASAADALHWKIMQN